MRDTSKKRQCSIYIPGTVPPMRCEADAHKAGRCLSHWTDWRNAREGRRIEQHEYRQNAKRNKRGRVTPPVIARVTSSPKPYTKQSPRSKADYERVARAEAKRMRKYRRTAVEQAA